MLLQGYSSGVVYVMRHGQTILDTQHRSDGWLDYPLSDKGRIGLIKAQQYLKNSNIDTVYAPSLRRAFETAHIIASGILSGPKVEIADQARTWHLGALMGTKKKPNKIIVKYYMQHTTQRPEGGESMKEFHDRFMPWLWDLLDKARQGNNYLLVTSGSNLRMLSQAITGNKDTFDLDEAGLMVIRPTSEHRAEGAVLFGHKSKEDEIFS